MEIKKENMEWLAEAMHYVKSKVNENLPKLFNSFSDHTKFRKP